MEKAVEEAIKLHEECKCSCEGYDPENDTRMCDAYAYLTGNISLEDLEETLGE